MESTKNFGRTASDALLELLHSWKLLLSAILLGGTLFLLILCDAEPGSTIEIFGIKYQRAKTRPPALVTRDAKLDSYLLPEGIILSVKQERAIPILDGSLALEPLRGTGSTPGQPLLFWLSGVSLVGPNITKIKIATRTPDGRSGYIATLSGEEDRVELSTDSYQELEYRGRYFALQIDSRSENETTKVSVKQIKEATLDLLPVSKLPKKEVGGDN